jgi:PhnB protein
MSVDIPQVMEMDKVFNQLAVNGKVEMPLQDTFWGARFGILIDQFGIRWMLNCDLN